MCKLLHTYNLESKITDYYCVLIIRDIQLISRNSGIVMNVTKNKIKGYFINQGNM